MRQEVIGLPDDPPPQLTIMEATMEKEPLRHAIEEGEISEPHSGEPATIRERMLDKTIADSFPASDPPSTDPDPAFDSFAG
jgi:hypothetical protein